MGVPHFCTMVTARPTVSAIARLTQCVAPPGGRAERAPDLDLGYGSALSLGVSASAMLRWTEFTRGLREEPPRELKRLPDFADVAREQKAMSFASAYPDPHRALEFLVRWPDLPRAASVAQG